MKFKKLLSLMLCVVMLAATAFTTGCQKEEKEETHSGSKAGGQDRGERVEGSGVEVVMTVQMLRNDEVGGGRRVGRRIFYVKLIYQ